VRLGSPGATDPNALSEREILYKVLFDMRSEIHDLKQLVMGLIAHGGRLEGDDVDLADRVFRTDGATWVLEEERGSGLSSASPPPPRTTVPLRLQLRPLQPPRPSVPKTAL
jgi:hypothetical protein